MKRLKRLCCTLACSMITLASLGNTLVYADTQINKIEYPESFYPGEQGAYLPFKSIDTEPVVSSRKSYGSGDLIYTRTYRNEMGTAAYTESAYYVSKSFIEKKFVKYLTQSWAPSDHYDWSKTVTTTITGSGSAAIDFAKKVAGNLGLSVSRSTSYAVSTSVPADKNRLSKLGFASDYTKFVYDYKKYKDGKLTKSSRDSYNAPEEDTYLVVYYK